MTASMLSQIDRDLVNPSINTLKLISMALDVPMYKFFLSEEEDGTWWSAGRADHARQAGDGGHRL